MFANNRGVADGSGKVVSDSGWPCSRGRMTVPADMGCKNIFTGDWMAERQRQSLKLVASETPLPPEMERGGPRLGGSNDISTLLAEERGRQGVDQREVAASLRIRLSYIQAIEDGRFGDLPGPTYAIGFIRAYASYLGLDDEAVVRLFKVQAGDADSRPELVYPTPLPEGRFLGRRTIVASLSLAALVYGGWYYMSVEETGLMRGVPEVPARIAQSMPDALPTADAPGGVVADALPPATMTEAVATVPPARPIPAPADTVAVAASPVAAPPGIVGEVGPTPVQGGAPAGATVASVPPASIFTPPAGDIAAEESGMGGVPLAPPAAAGVPPVAGDVVADAPVIRVSPDQAAAATPPPPASAAVPRGFDTASFGHEVPRVYGEENFDARIVLRAREDSWVQVRDRSNAVILTRILRRGDRYKVPNEPGLTLLTGNAGGLTLTVDGVAIPPLGAPGEVLRDVALESDRLLARSSAAVPAPEN